MLRRIIIFNAFCLFFAASYIVVPGPTYPATKGEVWPKPQQETKEWTYYKLSPAVFKFTVSKNHVPDLQLIFYFIFSTLNWYVK